MDYTGLEFGKEGGAEYARFFVNSHFDADRIFDCGQCFRFGRITSADGYPEWGGVAFGRYIAVRQTGSEVTLFGTGEEDFFGRRPLSGRLGWLSRAWTLPRLAHRSLDQLAGVPAQHHRRLQTSLLSRRT